MKLSQINRIAVIGLGRMGHGIAQTFAVSGYQVSGYDVSIEARDSANQRIRRNLEEFVSHGLLVKDEIEPTIERIFIKDTESEAVSGAQFVVEAIAEDLVTKQEFFARIEDAVEDETILASNSSTFKISDSGNRMRLPHRAIVTHWFNPPHIVPAVEIVPSPLTTEEIIKTSLELHKKIGKLAVLVKKEIPGFLVNRVQTAMYREVWDLYEKGIASAEDIDSAIQGSLGFRLATNGPLSVCDFSGLDIWEAVYKGLAPDLRSDSELPKSIQNIVDSGQLGLKTGSGIYKYDTNAIDQHTAQRDAKLLSLAKFQRDKTDENS